MAKIEHSTFLFFLLSFWPLLRDIAHSREQPCGCKRCPQRESKNTTLPNPVPLLKTTRKDSDNSQQSVGMLAGEYNPQFCPATFWGPPPTPGGPTGLLGSQQDNQEGNSFPGKETTSNWSPKANAQDSSKILLGLSACHYEFGKERTTWSFTFLSPPGPADRDLGEMTSIRILTLGCLLPVSPGFRRLWSEWGIPAGLILVARSSWAGGKIAESTLVIDCSSPPPPFFPTKAPHKWKSLSRLKVLAVAAVTQDYPG